MRRLDVGGGVAFGGGLRVDPWRALVVLPAAEPPVNVAPSVAITAPAPGTTVSTGTPVNVTGTASDPDGTVSSVAVYLGDPESGGTLLGLATGTGVWTFSWTPLESQIGARTLYARATDNDGDTADSLGRSVTVELFVPAAVVRYFVSEAASGAGTLRLLDSGEGDPAHMAIVQNAGQPVYTTAATGRGLEWSTPQADDAGARVRVLPGSKIANALEGATEATIEVVAVFPAPGLIGTDTGCLFGVNQSDAENDVFSFWMAGGRLVVDYSTFPGFPNYAAKLFYTYGAPDPIPAGRHVFHAVVKTTEADRERRIRLFVDGVEKVSTEYTAESNPAFPQLGDEIAFPWSHPDGYWLSMGSYNNALYYPGSIVNIALRFGALYAAALTEAQISARVAELTPTDDPALGEVLTGTRLLSNAVLRCATAPALTNGMTVCGWVRFPPAGTWQGLLAIQETVFNPSVTLDRADTGELRAYSIALDGAYTQTEPATTVPDLEEWTFFALTLSPGAGPRVLRFYTGSDVVALDERATMPYTADVDPNQILLGDSGYGEFLNGDLQYVRVFADELSLLELNAEKESAAPVLTPWARWDLVNGVLLDSSGNARHLTLEAGAVAWTTQTPITAPAGPTQPPLVAITAPAAASTVYAGEAFTVSGIAADAHAVSFVDVYLGDPGAGGEWLGRATGAEAWSLSVALRDSRAGARTLYARATNADGFTSTTARAVTVGSALERLTNLAGAAPLIACWGSNYAGGTWTNRGSGGDLTQGTALSQPVGATVESDFGLTLTATDPDWLTVPLVLSTRSQFTLCLSFVTTTGATNRDLFSCNNTSFLIRYTTGGLLRVHTGAGAYGEVALPSGRRCDLVVKYGGAGATNADRLKVWINGRSATLAFVGTIIAAMATHTTSRLGYNTGGSNPTPGTIWGFAVLPTALADAVIENELRAAWGAVLRGSQARKSLPIGNVHNTFTHAIGIEAQNVWTFAGTQFATYAKLSGNLIAVAARALPDGAWTEHVSPISNPLPADPHYFLSGCADGAGHNWIGGLIHNEPMTLWRGSSPGAYNLDAWRALPIVPGDSLIEDSCSYEQFARFPDGDLLLTFRDGGAAAGNTHVRVYDVTAGTWTTVARPLVLGTTLRSAYLNQPVIDRFGVVHLFWLFYEDASTALRGLYYARSADRGVTWTRADGSPLTLPITNDAGAERIAVIGEGLGLVSMQGAGVDDAGRPLVVTSWNVNGDGVYQHVVYRWTGSTWAASTIGGETAAAPPVQDLSRARVFSRGGRTWVIFRSKARGEGVRVAETTDFSAWDVWRLSDEILHEWQPSLDVTRWETEGVYSTLLYDARDGGTPAETPAWALDWRPLQ